jgi:uncharacterized membrane protein YciS (DUF1049 family)
MDSTVIAVVFIALAVGGIIGWLLLVCLFHSMQIRRLVKLVPAANEKLEAETEPAEPS